jgi:acyl-CoA thioester hydrolase
MESVHRFNITVSAELVDENRHVNNVACVQWMQDAAIAHATASGCTAMTKAIGATWVARTHHIEYLSPAFGGDVITIMTWVADFRRVRSLRCYKFFRATDRKVLARGETDWVFVDAATGRPRAIPEQIRNLFIIVSEEPQE